MDKWMDRDELMPKEEPHRNIEIKYKDAGDQEFTGLVSSHILGIVCFTHWRETKTPLASK